MGKHGVKRNLVQNIKAYTVILNKAISKKCMKSINLAKNLFIKLMLR